MNFDTARMLKRIKELDKELEDTKNARDDLYRAYVVYTNKQGEK